MKEIKAYVRNEMLDDVIDALGALRGVTGIAVVSLREFGHAANTGTLTRVEMAKLELDCADSAVDEIIECILSTGRTGRGHAGDGKVFVSRVERAVRIEDGVEGDAVVEESAHQHPHDDHE